MTHLLHPGLLHSFTLPMDREHYVRFYVWASKKDMQSGNSNLKDKDYLGSATGNYFGHANGRIAIPKRFGEVHLVKEYLSARIVAHEINHLLTYWADAHSWMPMAHDEQLARLCGELHRRFWKEIYKYGLARN